MEHIMDKQLQTKWNKNQKAKRKKKKDKINYY